MSYLSTFDSQSLDLTRRRFLQVAGAGAGVATVGLNTVAPIDDGRYRSLRSWLALYQSEVHRIDEGLALHLSLGSLKARYDRGDVAIVEGVGYGNPSLSHFDSVAMWREGHAGTVAGVRADTGWIGRYLDARGLAGC